jgi:hypothetical protein
MLNIAAASSISAAQPWPGSSTYHTSWPWSCSSTYHFQKFIPSTPYEREDYPPEVSVEQNFMVYGRLMKNNTAGVPNVGFNGPDRLFHGEIIANVPNPTMWMVQTDKHGNFVDTFHFDTPGRHVIFYVYITGDNDLYTSDAITIYAVPD